MKYPRQIGAVLRKDKTFSIEEYFFSPGEEDSPMEMHSGFSRCVFSIVAGKEQANTANIPARDIPLLLKKTDICTQKMMEWKAQSSIASKVSKCQSSVDSKDDIYVLKLISSNFRGKSVAEVLLESPENKEILLRDRAFLQQNVSKYPTNTKLIEAIDGGITMFENGTLVGTGETVSLPIAEQQLSLYLSSAKFMKKKDEKGRDLIYQIKIICNLDRNYPYEVEIKNCYAPLRKNSNGGTEIVLSEAVNVTKNIIHLMEEEWYSLVSRMNENKKLYERMMYEKQLHIMQKYAWSPEKKE